MSSAGLIDLPHAGRATFSDLSLVSDRRTSDRPEPDPLPFLRASITTSRPQADIYASGRVHRLRTVPRGYSVHLVLDTPKNPSSACWIRIQQEVVHLEFASDIQGNSSGRYQHPLVSGPLLPHHSPQLRDRKSFGARSVVTVSWPHERTSTATD
jgi:hypothetical protein